jgi:hypothetical protein
VATRAVRASPGKTAPSFADCVSRQAACRRPDSSASSYSSLCSVPLSAPASDRPALPSCLSIKFGAIRLMNHEHIARARPDLEAVACSTSALTFMGLALISLILISPWNSEVSVSGGASSNSAMLVCFG